MRNLISILALLFITSAIHAQELNFEYSQTFNEIERAELSPIIESWLSQNAENPTKSNPHEFVYKVSHKVSDVSKVSEFGKPSIEQVSSDFKAVIQVKNQNVLIQFSNPYLNADSLIIDSAEIESKLAILSSNLFTYIQYNKNKDASQDYNLKLLDANLKHTKDHLTKSANKQFISLGIGLIGNLVGGALVGLPQIVDLDNPKPLVGAGIGVSSLSSVVSFSFGISAIKEKKRAGEYLKEF